MSKLVFLVGAGAALAAAACSDATRPSATANAVAVSLTSAFASTPAGFSSLTSSYDADSAPGPFMPGFGHDGRGGFGPPGPGPGFGLGLMGGGLDGLFFGDGFGPAFDDRPFDGRGLNGPGSASCSYSTSAGTVTCASTRDGITVTQTTRYTTAAGTPQSTRDSTTNTVATQVTVTGSATRRDSSTSTVNESSAETVTGLASASAGRTYNGTSSGTESSAGRWRDTSFTATRVVADTIAGVVLPAPAASGPHYPAAGTIVRTMRATVAVSGQAPATSSRREAITYDGTSTATVVITMNDSTQTCTLALPRGRLSCQ